MDWIHKNGQYSLLYIGTKKTLVVTNLICIVLLKGSTCCNAHHIYAIIPLTRRQIRTSRIWWLQHSFNIDLSLESLLVNWANTRGLVIDIHCKSKNLFFVAKHWQFEAWQEAITLIQPEAACVFKEAMPLQLKSSANFKSN